MQRSPIFQEKPLAFVKRVSPQELSRLIPQSILFLHWLRHKAPNTAADIICNNGRISVLRNQTQSEKSRLYESLQHKLTSSVEQILKAVEEEGTDNLKTEQIRYILSCYDIEVWAECVKVIITRSEPPLIDSHICEEILENVKLYMEFEGKNIDELYASFIRTFEAIPLHSFHAVAELCALIRDCSKNPTKAAYDLAPLLLMNPEMELSRENTSAAKFIFRRMVLDCERLFGQTARKSNVYSAFGERKTIVSSKATKMISTSFWSIDKLLPKEVKRRKDLTTFYVHVDKKYVDVVDRLFELHSFIDIAHAIYLKYGMIPQPWRKELQDLKSKMESLPWFNHLTIETPNPGRDRFSAKRSAGTGRSSSSRAKDVGRIPSRSSTSTNRTSALSGNSKEELVGSDLLRVHKGLNDYPRMDAIIDNIIDTELAFLNGVRLFGLNYTSSLREIAMSVGSSEANALNLNMEEIDILFGSRWQSVMNFSHRLLTTLEPIKLLRTPTIGATSRIAFLSETLRNAIYTGELYASYGEFSATYAVCSSIFQKKMQVRQFLYSNARSKAALKKKKSTKNQINRDFIDIWETERPQNPYLKALTMQEVLEIPFTRINYFQQSLQDILDEMNETNKDFMGLSSTIGQLENISKQLRKAGRTKF